MSAKTKNRYMCLFCGEFSEAGAETCSVNFHYCEELQLNNKGNGYRGDYQMGGAHVSCLERYLSFALEEPDWCAVCRERVTRSQFARSTKLAVYLFRKKGCKAVILVHDKCFRTVKHKDFPFLKGPRL